MKDINVGMSEAVKGLTMECEFRVTGLRWFKVRLWFGTQLLRAAALVIGFGIEIKEAWPFPPPTDHPIMDRGELERRYQQLVREGRDIK